MVLKQKLYSLFDEKSVFLFVLLVNILLICSLKFIPSMDGPAHLYNSNILLSLIKESHSPLNDFYTVNSFYFPNWLSHSLLACFRILLPAWLAEKLLIILYITGLALSFRLLIKKINPENLSYSIMIFPFIYSFLFHLGFYNYCLSFIFFFYTIYYWIKNRHDISPGVAAKLLLLFTLTYYSALLTFLFLGLCIGILILSEALLSYLKTRLLVPSARFTFRALFQLFVAALPGMVLLIIFSGKTEFPGTDQHARTGELIKWINDVRPLIVYNYAREEIFTEQILHILIAIFTISLLFRFSSRKKIKFNLNDTFIIPVLIALLLLFTIPSGAYAGMMSDRFALMFYMLLIILVLSQKLPGKIRYIFIPLILIIHFIILLDHYYSALKELNKDAVMINNTAEMIPEGSIVLPVDLSENWIQPHFSNYLGAEKGLIILDNYEASVGWFPVRWNSSKMPDILLDDHSSIDGISWQTNTQNLQSRQIDYILLYGRKNLSCTNNFLKLDQVIKEGFIPVYSSDDQYIKLFRKK